MSIPKDGYYSANIWNDDGRVARDLVLFTNGTPRNEAGLEVGLAAIENLRPATLEDMCACWPKSMAMELQALRTANAGLVDRVRRLEAWGDRLEELLGDPPSANCSCHISPPCNDCVEWAAIREAKAEWSNAKGQP